jgi:hypothetical protein
MLSRICFGVFIISFMGVIIEGFVLGKNLNSFIMLVSTGIIMTLSIITIESKSHGDKRLRF